MGTNTVQHHMENVLIIQVNVLQNSINVYTVLNGINMEMDGGVLLVVIVQMTLFG